jgi:hypothetical protein
VRTLTLLFLIVLVPAVLIAQVPSSDAVETGEIPEEFEEMVRDLVDRYEELRLLLRREIEKNANLYSQAEIDAAVAEVENRLNSELAAANERIALLEAQRDALSGAVRLAEAEFMMHQGGGTQTAEELAVEVESLRATIESIEEESLFQIGATFSPAGTLGAIGILNLPQTNVSLLTGTTYFLREQEFNLMLGVTLSFLPAREISDRFARRGSGDSDDPAAAEQSSDTVDAESTGEGLSETE